MVLVKKWPFFHVFFLGIIGHENFFYNILERKNVFLAYKKRSSKSRIIEIFPKGLTHGFGQKTAIFPCLSFFCNIGQENVISIFQNKKTPFYPIKTTRPKSRKIKPIKKRSSKGRKIEIFRTGLTHGFGQEMAIFPSLFFFCNIGQENVFYNILEQKNAFLAYKNNTFKKSKNWDFSKGVNPWFWSKNGLFSLSSY